MLKINAQSVIRNQSHVRLFKYYFQKHGLRLLSNYRRTMLLTPANHTNKVKKSMRLKVDCVALDIEDSVHPIHKENARINAKNILDSDLCASTTPELWVKINSVASGLCSHDLKCILNSNQVPSIILSKVESEDDLQSFAEELWQNMLQKESLPINLILSIESSRGLVFLSDLCKKAENLSTLAPIKPTALLLGGSNLIADMDCQRTKMRMELFYARYKLVAVAKAFQLEAIDMACLNYQDLNSLKTECREASAMGFTGKLVVHPSQIPVVEECFIPSNADIEWAESLLASYETKQDIQTFRGEIIDLGLIKQANKIIAKSRK